MEFHSIGLGAVIVFLLFLLFVSVGLWVAYIAIKILNQNFRKKTGKGIFFQLYFVIAYSLLGILYRQGINLKIIIFSNPDLEMYINWGFTAVYIVFCIYLLQFVLNSIHTTDKTTS